MRFYYFRCYWSSNVVFVVRCVTYVPNLRKIGQKLRSISWTIGISGRHTDIHSSDYISVQCHSLHGQTKTIACLLYALASTVLIVGYCNISFLHALYCIVRVNTFITVGYSLFGNILYFLFTCVMYMSFFKYC